MHGGRLVKAMITFGRWGLEVRADLAEFQPGAEPAGSRFYTYRFNEAYTRATKGSPFPRRDEPTEAEAASAAHWLSGQPSQLEVALRRSFADFRAITSRVHAHLPAQGVDIRQREWWRDLPRLQSLHDRGVVKCRGFFCKQPFLEVVDGRLWYVPGSSQGLAIVDSVAVTTLQ